ncbi:MAG: PTS transporter subunit EIIC [Spirochaetaceae bacterium]|jgi:PTS system cellobiose-specific IIC component|nr:PTS transporter subunit EIIC [Spirochaetaceae bacterium]
MGNEKSSKFFDKFFGAMDKVSAGLNRVNALMAIKDSFVDLMPFIIVGSFATLFGSVICSPTSGLAKFGVADGEIINVLGHLRAFQPLFSAINYATMNVMALALAYLVGSAYARYFKELPRQISGLCALTCYIILIPTFITSDGKTINNLLQANYTNARGLFLAIIAGLLSIKLFSKIVLSGRLTLKMPASVPAGVASSFAVLFPLIAACTVFGIINFAFRGVTGMYVSDAIYKFLQLPMEGVMQRPWGVIILVLFCQAFWVVGIHGSNVVEIVRSSVGLATIAANLAAFQAGEKMTNIFTYTFWNTYCTIGGSGCTLGLLIAIFIASKKEDARAIGKLSLVPAFFGINEPLIFGLPIVLNPMFVIPFVLAPAASAAIGYISTAAGIAGPAMYMVPWTTPFLVNGFLSTGGNIGTVITQLVCIAVTTLIYLPFVKMNNLKTEEAA